VQRDRRNTGRLGLLIGAACLAALVTLPQTAAAVLSGVNGRIVFASGRNPATDATARLYLRPAFGSTGAGSASAITTATGVGQHRHITWSPDRTKITYAEGDNATANYDIFILDLTNPSATPQNVTQSNNVTDDHPAWSPDGTRIAFDSENTDGSNQLNLKIYNVGTGVTTDLTSTTAGTYEHDPGWTPDSQTLFYGVGNPTVAGATDVVRQPADGSTGPSNVAAAPGTGEFQPSVSPDGTKLCFTRGDFGSDNARVIVSLLNGGGQMPLPIANAALVASYDCTWSPDGTKILYTLGKFSTGDLVMENSDLSGGFVSLEGTANRFDGTADWAPDGRPQCTDQTAITTIGKPVSIPFPCEDTGPAYERTQVHALVQTGPTNGTVSPGPNDPPVTLPANITYTPNSGFLGTDSFIVRSTDDIAFGDRDGTIRVRVTTPCANRTPTVLGTTGSDQLVGTGRADVISALGGNDKVKALGGNDIVCGGPGKDTLKGGAGKDKLLGQGGKDSLKGGGGKDTCKGGKGRDTASACEVRKSI
jgi:Ca2+-binding RTX toxin-like protein